MTTSPLSLLTAHGDVQLAANHRMAAVSTIAVDRRGRSATPATGHALPVELHNQTKKYLKNRLFGAPRLLPSKGLLPNFCYHSTLAVRRLNDTRDEITNLIHLGIINDLVNNNYAATAHYKNNIVIESKYSLNCFPR